MMPHDTRTLHFHSVFTFSLPQRGAFGKQKRVRVAPGIKGLRIFNNVNGCTTTGMALKMQSFTPPISPPPPNPPSSNARFEEQAHVGSTPW
jgi:hypothetical protein